MIHYQYNKELLHDKNLLIHHHLGMGDHIVLVGLVNHIAENHDPDKIIYLLCKENNFVNVKKLFEDTKNIIVLNTKGVDEYVAAQQILSSKNLSYLKIGHEKYNVNYELLNNWDCGQVFYHLAQIPYEYRFTKFKLNYDKEKNVVALKTLNPDDKPYVFVHDDPKRNFNLSPQIDSKYHIIRNDLRFSLLEYVSVLQNAEEIHLMPSAFYCLIESLPDIKAKLFCYNIRNVNFGNCQKYNWVIK